MSVHDIDEGYKYIFKINRREMKKYLRLCEDLELDTQHELRGLIEKKIKSLEKKLSKKSQKGTC